MAAGSANFAAIGNSFKNTFRQNSLAAQVAAKYRFILPEDD
jgi:hypothetical protein